MSATHATTLGRGLAAATVAVFAAGATAAQCDPADMFGPLVTITEPLLYPAAVGDLNGDGVPDLAAFLNFNTIQSHFARGDSTFAPGPTTRIGTFSNFISTDVNGDGILDIGAWSWRVPIEFAVFSGNSDGTFTRTVIGFGADAGNWRVGTMILADVNADNTTDYAYTYVSGIPSTTIVRVGSGGAPDQAVTYPTGPYSGGIRSSDINSDGILDLIVYRNGTRACVILFGNGDGTFEMSSPLTVSPFTYGSVYVEDFDNDGQDDILALIEITSPSPGLRRSLRRGNGDGSFREPEQSTIPFPNGVPFWLKAMDLDHDGNMDFLTVGSVETLPRQTIFGYLRGDGNGSFMPVPEADYVVDGAQWYGVQEVVDFNGDSTPDLLLAIENTNTLGAGVVLLNPCNAPCPADLTLDGQVDSGDLSLFITAFLAQDANLADLTGDGQVDSGDLSAFIDLFLTGCGG